MYLVLALDLCGVVGGERLVEWQLRSSWRLRYLDHCRLTRNAQRPHGAEDEDLASGEEGNSDGLDEIVRERSEGRLVLDGIEEAWVSWRVKDHG